jgi:hypothetical protein
VAFELMMLLPAVRNSGPVAATNTTLVAGVDRDAADALALVEPRPPGAPPSSRKRPCCRVMLRRPGCLAGRMKAAAELNASAPTAGARVDRPGRDASAPRIGALPTPPLAEATYSVLTSAGSSAIEAGDRRRCQDRGNSGGLNAASWARAASRRRFASALARATAQR